MMEDALVRSLCQHLGQAKTYWRFIIRRVIEYSKPSGVYRGRCMVIVFRFVEIRKHIRSDQ